MAPNRHGPKIGGCTPFLCGGGQLGQHLIQCRLVRRRLATIDVGQELERCAPPFWGNSSPSSTMRPGPRSASIPSGILMRPAVLSQWKEAENWGALPLFGQGELGPYLAQCGLDRGPPPCQVATIDVGRKLERCAPLFWGE